MLTSQTPTLDICSDSVISSLENCHLDITPSADSDIYQLKTAINARQLCMFVLLQVVFTCVLIWFSIVLLNVLLAHFFEATSISIILAIYCVSTVFWQASYIYRIANMKKAVLIHKSPAENLKIAMATTIVPSREFEVLADKLEAMLKVNACNNDLELWVLDEEDDPRVHRLINELNSRPENENSHIFHFSRKNIAKYNESPSGKMFKKFQAKQKGGNINAWLDFSKDRNFDLITFLDSDHIPQPFYYEEVLPYFKDTELSFLQAPEAFKNKHENFISKAASYERDSFFGLIHRCFLGLGMPILVGSHTTFRASVFELVGGHYPVHLTEDFLLMLKLRAAGLKGVYIDKVLAYGELPATWDAYLGQQLRWASGGLDLLFRYFPLMWKGYTIKERLFSFVLLNYYAWGSFFILAKIALFVLIVNGVGLHISPLLLFGMLAFVVVSTVVNFFWDRQFYIETDEKSYLIQNMLMNNFIGALYFISLIKALFRPNTDFKVTAKKGVKEKRHESKFSYFNISVFILMAELIVFFVAWSLSEKIESSQSSSGFDFLIIPLVMSFFINLAIIIFYKKIEDGSKHITASKLPAPITKATP